MYCCVTENEIDDVARLDLEIKSIVRVVSCRANQMLIIIHHMCRFRALIQCIINRANSVRCVCLATMCRAIVAFRSLIKPVKLVLPDVAGKKNETFVCC
jgi:hypothetical protein